MPKLSFLLKADMKFWTKSKYYQRWVASKLLVSTHFCGEIKSFFKQLLSKPLQEQVICLGGRGPLTCSQEKPSALEAEGKAVFPLFVLGKGGGDELWLHREGSGVLVGGGSIWKTFKVKTSSLKIRLKGSEKLDRERRCSVATYKLNTQNTPNEYSPRSWLGSSPRRQEVGTQEQKHKLWPLLPARVLCPYPPPLWHFTSSLAIPGGNPSRNSNYLAAPARGALWAISEHQGQRLHWTPRLGASSLTDNKTWAIVFWNRFCPDMDCSAFLQEADTCREAVRSAIGSF